MTALSVARWPRGRARRRLDWPGVATYAASVLGILALWAVAATVVDSIYFPQPWTVVQRFVELAGDRLPHDVRSSVLEALGGWLIGSTLGIVVGAAIGASQTLAELVKPLLNFLRHISPLAWVPLMILWFGIGYWSKTGVIVLIAFFNLVVNTAHGVSGIDATTLKVSRVLRQNRRQRLEVRMMSAMPDILVGLRFALGTAWGGVVISELVAGNTGLGALELYGGQAFDVPQVMSGMIAIAVLSLLANALFLAIQKRAFPWMISNRSDVSGATV